MKECSFCPKITCKQTKEGLEITDRLTNFTEIRSDENIKLCPIREKYYRRSEIIYEK